MSTSPRRDPVFKLEARFDVPADIEGTEALKARYIDSKDAAYTAFRKGFIDLITEAKAAFAIPDAGVLVMAVEELLKNSLKHGIIEQCERVPGFIKAVMEITRDKITFQVEDSGVFPKELFQKHWDLAHPSHSPSDEKYTIPNGWGFIMIRGYLPHGEALSDHARFFERRLAA